MDAAYGAPLARRYLAVDDVTVPGAQRLPLHALADWAQTAVVQARVGGVKCGGFLPCAWHRP
ncbi:MAG: hypothetical protein V9G22_16925 [Ottowia sp.]